MMAREISWVLGAIEKSVLSPKDARALATIATMGGVNTSGLAISLGIREKYASEIARRLQRWGLVFQHGSGAGFHVSTAGAAEIEAWKKGRTNFPK